MELPRDIDLFDGRGSQFQCIDKDNFLLNAAIHTPVNGGSIWATVVWVRLDKGSTTRVLTTLYSGKSKANVEPIPFYWDADERVIYHIEPGSDEDKEHHQVCRTFLPTGEETTPRTTMIKKLRFEGRVLSLVRDPRSGILYISSSTGWIYSWCQGEKNVGYPTSQYLGDGGIPRLAIGGPEKNRLLLSLVTDTSIHRPIDGLSVYDLLAGRHDLRRPPPQNLDPRYETRLYEFFRAAVPRDIFLDASPLANVYMVHDLSRGVQLPHQPSLVRYSNVCANLPQPQLETVHVAPRHSNALNYCCHVATGQLFMLIQNKQPGSTIWLQPVPSADVQVQVVSTRDVVDELVRVELSLLASVFPRDLLRMIGFFLV